VKRPADAEDGPRQRQRGPEAAGVKRGAPEVDGPGPEDTKKVRSEAHDDILLVLHPGYSERGQPKKTNKERNDIKKTCRLLSIKATDRIKNIEGKEAQKDEDHEVLQDAAWDDLTGAELDAREVRKARKLEIEYARRKKVWVKISRAEARRRGLKIIKMR